MSLGSRNPKPMPPSGILVWGREPAVPKGSQDMERETFFKTINTRIWALIGESPWLRAEGEKKSTRVSRNARISIQFFLSSLARCQTW